MKRLWSISWDEFRIRSQQELSKRWDLLRYKVNPEYTTGLASAPLISERRTFPLFSPTDLPGLIAKLKKRFPLEASAIICHAEQICEHQFDLLGFERLFYGRKIDWHLDAVHAKRAPQNPGFAFAI